MFFYVFKSFLIYIVKNNFKKIKNIYIILMCFEMKNILKRNRYHIFKHFLVREKKHYYNK